MEQRTKVGIVGLGLMGRSITTCILAAGHKVTALTNEMFRAEDAKAQIFDYLNQLRAEGMLRQEPKSLISNLTITNDFTALTDHGIVIESIVENIDQKKIVYQELEKVLSPTAIIGSNTSSIPVTILQSGLSNPERLLGIHWAEPAHVTRFIEIICGTGTDIKYAQAVFRLSETWGKEPSLVKKDIRGFITNRLMYAMIREGLHLVENDFASIEDIDRACRNDLGYWITFAGPFRFMDLTGIPAYLTVMRDLFPELSDNDKAPAFVEDLVSSGAKGVTNAKGFYRYTPESAERWEKLFLQFTYEIRKLAEKYPHNAGDIDQKT